MTAGRDDLSTSTMDGVSVKGGVLHIEADTTHVFVTHDSLLGGPLEASNAGVLDLVEVLHSLGGVNEQVCSSRLWSKGPDPLASVASNSNSLQSFCLRALGSSLGVTFPSSISAARPSGRGAAVMYSLLCLLGDLDRQTSEDSSETVSR